ncbi:thiazole synthase [soil metagenome]
MSLTIGNISLNSRLFLGTARYPSPAILRAAIQQSQTEVITVSLRRQSLTQGEGSAFWDYIKDLGCHILPNTAGCYGVKEAIVTAQMAREVFNTSWIKLEVIGDDYTLQPDPFGLLEAAKELIAQGFEVFPYCTDDLILCQRLVDVGCKILMPWAAPIGSAKGLLNPYALKTLRERLPEAILIVDAGIGAPSHAAAAMELGFDAVLLNSAVALSQDPVKMAVAFAKAIEAGHLAAHAGLLPPRDLASPSTPVLGTPFWSE